MSRSGKPAFRLKPAATKPVKRKAVALDPEPPAPRSKSASKAVPDSHNASLDSYLTSLDDTLSSGVATLDSDDVPEATEVTAGPRSRPAKPANKLNKISKQHVSYAFTKKLYDPVRDESDTYCAELGIRVEGSDEGRAEGSIAPIREWETASLPFPMMRVLDHANYVRPTPIQAQALPIIMSGHDMLGIAPTGSGKTAAFLIPMCRHVAANLVVHEQAHARGPFALVLVPTRELCIQIYRELLPWTHSLQLHALSCYGGSDISAQISAAVNSRCHIVVATPGRLIDLLAANNGRVMTLSAVTFLVVDETDRMFDLGFGPQVRKIVESVRSDRQTVVFSATMPKQLEAFVRRILTDPLKVLVDARRGARTGSVPAQVEQKVFVARDDDAKFALLVKLLQERSTGSSTASSTAAKQNTPVATPVAIVFVNTQAMADALALRLAAKHVSCRALHGGMDQRDRDDVVADFRAGEIRVLVATSVAARGLDVPSLGAVVNFDAASHREDYVHRAGRTGRAGNRGECISLLLCTQDKEAFQLAQVMEPSSELREMADRFAATHAEDLRSAKSRWLGFGGHGLTRLDSKRDLQRSIEQEVLLHETGGSPMSRENTPELDTAVVKQAGKEAYTARLLIDEASKDSRLAVTAVPTQNDVMERYRVSLTLRGTYYANRPPSMSEDARLHILIEGSTRANVFGAYTELVRVMEAKDAEVEPHGRYSTF